MSPEPTHVWLVRHGEVVPEHQGSFYGGTEVPLSPAGRESSLALAERLAALQPDRVASSPLARALYLAQALADRSGAPLSVHPDLRELDRGQWTGRQREDVEADDPGAIARYMADPERHNGPGGEPESVFAARVHAVLDALVTGLPGGRLVVVAHGHVLRVTMRRLLGWDAPSSLARFVDYLGVVEALLVPGGSGELLAAPPGRLPRPLGGRTG